MHDLSSCFVDFLGPVCFTKVVSWKSLPNFSVFVYHKKSWSTETLSSQRKIWPGFQESVFLLFRAENTFQNCEKFRNVILFADYIKFGPQTFDCCIFCFESFFFSILSLRI